MLTNQQSNSLTILDKGSDARSAWTDVAIVGTQLTVTSAMATHLLEQYPTLALHACKSKGGSHFGDHLVGALLPHALEHLAIELLVRAYPGQTFAGATRWTQRSSNTMRVRVSLPREGGAAPVHGAFSDALLQLNRILILSEGQVIQKQVR